MVTINFIVLNITCRNSLPLPILRRIRDGKSDCGKSFAKRSSIDEIEEDLFRRGDEGGVEQELPPLLPSSLWFPSWQGELSWLDEDMSSPVWKWRDVSVVWDVIVSTRCGEQ